MADWVDTKYPTKTSFPTGHKDLGFGPDVYYKLTQDLKDMAHDVAQIATGDGNITLPSSSEVIKWSGTTEVEIDTGKIKVNGLKVKEKLVNDYPTPNTVTIHIGDRGSSSILRRRFLMWTSMVRS